MSSRTREDETETFGQVRIELRIVVGQARPPIEDLFALVEGTVLPLDRSVNDPVEVYVGERLIACGELEELGEDQGDLLAVRITKIASGSK